ncbi:MAG: hypothetical protein WCS94_01060 [Verrucomicrobiota bacterium]
MKLTSILSLLLLGVLSSVVCAEDQTEMLLNNGAWKVAPQTKHLTIEYNLADAKGEKPRLVVECWNNAPHATPQKPTSTPQKATDSPK